MKRIQKAEIEYQEPASRLADLDMSKKIGNKEEYVEQLANLQMTMLQIQQAYYRQRLRAVIVFEGWDAAGKGGAIRRLTERLDPRNLRVHPIGAPEAEEQSRHFLYRFWRRVPTPGEITIFDRSWYGRLLVERVEGLCSKSDWKRSYAEINDFEALLMDSGVRVVKIFLHITQKEQRKRFVERLQNPAKQWKLTRDDIRNRSRWSEYEAAIDDMLAQTSTVRAPWKVIPANRKWYARTETAKHVTGALKEGVDIDSPIMDPKLYAELADALGVDV